MILYIIPLKNEYLYHNFTLFFRFLIQEVYGLPIEKIDYKSEEYFVCDITPKRKTLNFELEIYTYGNGSSYINGKIYPHLTNKVIFAKPHQERFSTGIFHCKAIHFNCSDKDIIASLSTIPDCIYVDDKTGNTILYMYEKIDTKNELLTYSIIFDIFNTLKNLKTSNHINSSTLSGDILFIKEYIDKNFTNQVDVSLLAKQVHLSTNYIRKVFLNTYGVTIKQYLIEMRLGYVKKLISNTNMSLCDIAYESGFNSQSHMNYMFKLKFGISPLKYKQSLKT